MPLQKFLKTFSSILRAKQENFNMKVLSVVCQIRVSDFWIHCVKHVKKRGFFSARIFSYKDIIVYLKKTLAQVFACDICKICTKYLWWLPLEIFLKLPNFVRL